MFSELPKFWEEIKSKMGLESFDGIDFPKVLNFMGYKTIKSVAKLQQQKEQDRFKIEAINMNGTDRFREKFGDLKLDFHHGDTLVLNEIGIAAAACFYNFNHDINSIQNEVYKKCKKVSY